MIILQAKQEVLFLGSSSTPVQRADKFWRKSSGKNERHLAARYTHGTTQARAPKFTEQVAASSDANDNGQQTRFPAKISKVFSSTSPLSLPVSAI